MADKITPAKTEAQPLTNPATGAPLAPRKQPGYYPSYETMRQQKFWDEATRKVVVERVEGLQKPYGFFTLEEVRTLQAVVDRILPQDDRLPERRVPRMLSPVIIHVSVIARTCDQSRPANAACVKKLKAGNVASTRIKPAAMVAMEAGLAMVIQVHM